MVRGRGPVTNIILLQFYPIPYVIQVQWITQVCLSPAYAFTKEKIA